MYEAESALLCPRIGKPLPQAPSYDPKNIVPNLRRQLQVLKLNTHIKVPGSLQSSHH